MSIYGKNFNIYKLLAQFTACQQEKLDIFSIDFFTHQFYNHEILDTYELFMITNP